MSIREVDCCGCSACSIICPKKAINMVFGENGSYQAEVDINLCIECGACEKVCVVLNPEVADISQKNIYVAVAKNKDILRRSSSGGLGYILAETGLSLEYPVCSVSYDKQRECASHIIVDTDIDLWKTQGSKYLQSVNAETFREIVARGKGVVFGTPCQIAGLSKILEKKKIRENYILVDIFCHGVPNQLLWKRHLEYLKKIRRFLIMKKFHSEIEGFIYSVSEYIKPSIIKMLFIRFFYEAG